MKSIRQTLDEHKELPEAAGAHDDLFHGYVTQWKVFVRSGQFHYAEQVYLDVLDQVSAWETENPGKIAHKGAGYYYLGVTAIRQRDFDKAFLYLHRAVEEDRRNFEDSYRGRPACAFVTLQVPHPDGVAQPFAEEVAAFLVERFDLLAANHPGLGQFSDFEKKVLHHREHEELAFLLTHALFRVFHLNANKDSYGPASEFSGQLATGMIFDLCRVLENLIAQANEARTGSSGGNALGSKLQEFAKRHPKLSRLVASLKPMREGWEAGTTPAIENHLRYDFKPKDAQHPLDRVASDFVLAYSLRNHGGHDVSSLKVIYENFEEVMKRILFAIFFVVGDLPE